MKLHRIAPLIVCLLPFPVICQDTESKIPISSNHEHEDSDFHLHNHFEEKDLTTITINADPRNQSLFDSTDPISVIDTAHIPSQSAVTLGETVSSELGVRSSYFGPGASRPVIRGNTGDRIRVLSNGIGSMDLSNMSEDHQVTINPLTVDSIEILRGPETLLYGSSAIGGVVNTNSNTIPIKELTEPIEGHFDLRTQTVNDELTGAIAMQGKALRLKSGTINWHASGLLQETDDIRIPGFAESSQLRAQEEVGGEGHEEDQIKYKLDSSDSRTRTSTVGTSYAWDKGYIGFAFSGYGSRYGIPGHSHEGEHDHHEGEHDHEDAHDIHLEEEVDDHSEVGGVKIDLEQYKLEQRAEIRDVSKDIERIKVSSAFSNYDHAELEGATAGTRYSSDSMEMRAELSHAPIYNFIGTLGTQFEYNSFDVEGDEAFLPGSDRIAPGIFFFEEYPLLDDDLRLQFGSRYEFVSINPNMDFNNQSFNPFSVSTGLSYNIDEKAGILAGLSLAYAERAPSATELFADGIHAARQIAELGNTNLNNENSLGLDLTVKKNKGLITATTNLFIQEYFNYINLASANQEVEGFNQFAYNGVGARFYGVEIESTFHLHEVLELGSHEFDLGCQFEYLRAKDTDNGGNIPRIPPLRTIANLRYGYKDIFSAVTEGVFVGTASKTSEEELSTNAYQMLNLTLEYNLPYTEKKNLNIYLKGLNLTNEEARVHSSFIKDIAPLAGQSVLLGVRGYF